MVNVWRAKEAEVRGVLSEFHVLTYAEDGFSPLDIHARRFGIDREQVRVFADLVNDRSCVGSLHPQAPISAVPRELVRDRKDVYALAASIAEFLLINREMIGARRVVLDFRTPSVPAFAITALDVAFKTDIGSSLQDVLILVI